jgi:hypothetical protein
MFILGCGPSLTQETANKVRGRGTTMAIKEAVHLAPWADMLFANTYGFFIGEALAAYLRNGKEALATYLNGNGKVLWINKSGIILMSAAPAVWRAVANVLAEQERERSRRVAVARINAKVPRHSVGIFAIGAPGYRQDEAAEERTGGTPLVKLHTHANGPGLFSQSRMSGPGAVQAAMALGFKRIVLVGYDCKPPYNNTVWQAYAPSVREYDAEILNATPGSDLSEFPIVTLDEALAEKVT